MEINIIEAKVCIDHVHMLIEVLPKHSISGVMGYLKGKSSQIIFERCANARFKYRNRSFWARGYYVDTVGKNTKKIAEYIQNQLKEEREYDQLSMDFEDPFKDYTIEKKRVNKRTKR
jgi:putative transposase